MRNPNLSQHFLKNPRLALILIGHSNLKKRDLVLEIGAGSGVITSALSKRVKKVIAIEPDKLTAKKLRENLARHKIENRQISAHVGPQLKPYPVTDRNRICRTLIRLMRKT